MDRLRSTSETRRSKRLAQKIAEEILSKQGLVTEAHILKVLRAWQFKNNTTRQNVMPNGVESVFSDTLGLVQSRTGLVVLTKPTRKYPAVFKLLARWLYDHVPESFPFTSISVNFAYNARRHRDGGNLGPSVAFSLGDFTGGSLHYWGDDDSTTSLEKLAAFPPLVLKTNEGIVLFDGTRAHAVSAFEGERYSLVFFTHSCLHKASAADLRTIAAAGIEIPTERSLNLLKRKLAPARGYERSKTQWLSECVNRSLTTATSALVWPKTTTISAISDDAYCVFLSFLVEPLRLSELCRVCKRFAALANCKNAWTGSVVDTWATKPIGSRAHQHWTLWKSTRYVVNGRWALQNISLLLFGSTISPWRFQDGVRYAGAHIFVADQQRPYCFRVEFRLASGVERSMAIGLSTSANAHHIARALQGDTRNNVMTLCANLGHGNAFRLNMKKIGDAAPVGVDLRSALIGIRCIRLRGKSKIELLVDGVVQRATQLPNTLIPLLRFPVVLLPAFASGSTVRPVW